MLCSRSRLAGTTTLSVDLFYYLNYLTLLASVPESSHRCRECFRSYSQMLVRDAVLRSIKKIGGFPLELLETLPSMIPMSNVWLNVEEIL